MKKSVMIQKIFAAVVASGLTSHKFKDDDWRMIAEVRDTINRYFLQVGEPISCYYNHVFGYTNDGMAKDYELNIENADGELLGKGVVTACAAGTVNDVWSSYDICVTFWAV